MEIIGALAIQHKSIIYFCKYQGKESETKLLSDFTKGNRYSDFKSLNVSAIAIESADGLRKSMKMIGFTFKTSEDNNRRIVLQKGYEELSEYFKECLT